MGKRENAVRTGDMTTGAERDSERFAAALERGLSGGSVSPGDDELLRDLELVALLRESRASLAPSADASARMRAKVMAAAATMTPGPVADPSAPTEVVAADTTGFDTAVLDSVDEQAEPRADQGADGTNVVPIGAVRGRHHFPARLRSGENPGRRGALGVSAAAALMVLAVTGGGALFSQDALPGDTLYGVKQASESGMVALTPGAGKAQRQLDYAATRLDEAEALSSSRSTSGDQGSDVSQALRGFNEQATAGSRMWLAGGGGNSELASWASTQSQRLTKMRSTMPTSSRADADESLRVLDQMRTRANALNNRKGCDTTTTGQSDEFGPVPSQETCVTKDASAPATRQVVPSAPARERTSAPDVVPETTRSTQTPSTRQNTGNGPALELPELPGSGGDLGPLPGREPTTGGDTLPKAPVKEEPSTGLGGVLKGLLGG
jgi:hypothetical protein